MTTLVTAAGDAAKTGERVATIAATRTPKAAVSLRTQFAFALKLVRTECEGCSSYRAACICPYPKRFSAVSGCRSGCIGDVRCPFCCRVRCGSTRSSATRWSRYTSSDFAAALLPGGETRTMKIALAVGSVSQWSHLLFASNTVVLVPLCSY